ncbi:MAG TPA: cysteine-rich CWC family protein [Chitinophagaceae bacterium]|nr:cysteine-rich CWC family protein [Chitinophagaceae bacterium]
MPLHEEKGCPRCGRTFECKSGNIGQCGCTAFSLSAEERVFLAERYADCLCPACLHELKQGTGSFTEKDYGT